MSENQISKHADTGGQKVLNHNKLQKLLELSKISLAAMVFCGSAIAGTQQETCNNVRSVEVGGRLSDGAAFLEVRHHPTADGDIIAFRSRPVATDKGEVVTAIEARCDFRLDIWRDLSRDQVFVRLSRHEGCLYHQIFSDPLDRLTGNPLNSDLAIADLDTGISNRGYHLAKTFDKPETPMVEVFARHLSSGLCLGDRVKLLPDVK